MRLPVDLAAYAFVVEVSISPRFSLRGEMLTRVAEVILLGPVLEATPQHTMAFADTTAKIVMRLPLARVPTGILGGLVRAQGRPPTQPALTSDPSGRKGGHLLSAKGRSRSRWTSLEEEGQPIVHPLGAVGGASSGRVTWLILTVSSRHPTGSACWRRRLVVTRGAGEQSVAVLDLGGLLAELAGA